MDSTTIDFVLGLVLFLAAADLVAALSLLFLVIMRAALRTVVSAFTFGDETYEIGGEKVKLNKRHLKK